MAKLCVTCCVANRRYQQHSVYHILVQQSSYSDLVLFMSERLKRNNARVVISPEVNWGLGIRIMN
jgi:hypothetical protein